MCRVNARLSACVKIVKSGSCEGRRRRPEHKIYRVLHSYYRHHPYQVVTLHLYLLYFHCGTNLGQLTRKLNQFVAYFRSGEYRR